MIVARCCVHKILKSRKANAASGQRHQCNALLWKPRYLHLNVNICAVQPYLLHMTKHGHKTRRHSHKRNRTRARTDFSKNLMDGGQILKQSRTELSSQSPAETIISRSIIIVSVQEDQSRSVAMDGEQQLDVIDLHLHCTTYLPGLRLAGTRTLSTTSKLSGPYQPEHSP